MAKRTSKSSAKQQARPRKKSKFDDIDWNDLHPVSEGGDFVDTARTPLQRAFSNETPLEHGKPIVISSDHDSHQTSSELTNEYDAQPTRSEDDEGAEEDGEGDDYAAGPSYSDNDDQTGLHFDLSPMTEEGPLPSSPPILPTQSNRRSLPRPVLVAGPSLIPTLVTPPTTQMVSVPEKHVMEWQRLLSLVTPSFEQMETLRLIFEQVDWDADRAEHTFLTMQPPASERNTPVREQPPVENDFQLTSTGEEVPKIPAAIENNQPDWSTDSSTNEEICDPSEMRHYGPFLLCGFRTLHDFENWEDGCYLQMQCKSVDCGRTLVAAQARIHQLPEIFEAAEEDLILEYSTGKDPDFEVRTVTVPREARILQILDWPV